MGVVDPLDDLDATHPPLPLPRRVVGWAAIVEGALGGRPAKTRESYGRSLGEWTAWCAGDDLEPLQARGLDVQRWVDELAARQKPNTVARKLAALRAAYKVALREEVIHRNPTEAIRAPKIDKKKSTAVALTEQQLVGFAAAAVACGPFECAVVMLYFTQGLRASEPADADVDDFHDDVDPPVLRVTRKGGDRDDVPLAPPAAAALTAYLGDRRQGPLLVNPNTGQRLSRFAARRIVIRLAKQGKLPRGVTTHTFRHAYVTRAGDLKVPLEAVQDGAHHASPSTTRGYDRARQQRALQASSAVAGWLQLALDDVVNIDDVGSAFPVSEPSKRVEKPEAAQNNTSVRPDDDEEDRLR